MAVCPCCDPFSNCCTGGRRTPDSLLVTITGVTYKDGGITLSFPLLGSYVVGRVGNQCAQYLGQFYAQNAECFYCPGVNLVFDPAGYAGLTITAGGNSSLFAVGFGIIDPAAGSPGATACYLDNKEPFFLDSSPPPICDWLDGSASGSASFDSRPAGCSKIASITYTVEPA